MKSKENSKDYTSAQKKNLREKNSYQMQFKLKNNKKSEKNNIIKNDKCRDNCSYPNWNSSSKTFNQKQSSNLNINNKDLNAQSLINFTETEKNAASYSNFVNSDINALIKNEKNKKKNIIKNDLNKNNKIKDSDFKEIQNLKMDIKELTNSPNTKINVINTNNEKNINFFHKKAVDNPSKNEIEEKKLNNSSELIPNINNKNLNGFRHKIKGKISSKIYKKMKHSKELRNINGLKNFKLKQNKTQKAYKIEDEKNNSSKEFEIIENNPSLNSIKINESLLNNKINNTQIQDKNILKNKINNDEDKKFINLYSEMIQKIEDSKTNETINNFEENISTSKLFRVTYPNLKRYRQKSEPNIKINRNKLNLNERNNYIKNEENINTIKYPTISKNNNNLSKFKTLEDKIKNENSTKRKINSLLNKQSNPELKEILSNLKITMDKFNKNEEKEGKYLSTLPANYLSPFDTFQFENNDYNYKKFNFKYNKKNYNTKLGQSKGNNKKLEKFRSTFNDFKKIINSKNKNKDKNGQKYFYQNRIIYSNLYPVNNLENNIFTLES